MDQMHQEKVLDIERPGIYTCDAIFTKLLNNILIVRTADCLPIIFSDTNSQRIGVLHMGWKSAQKGILNNLPYSLEGFKVILGVGLRKCCYQVGEEFSSYKEFSPFLTKKDDNLFF